jgi:hypothetical protein
MSSMAASKSSLLIAANQRRTVSAFCSDTAPVSQEECEEP